MLKTNLWAVLLFSAIISPQVNTARQYPIDTSHSTVGFAVPILDGLSKVSGKFTDFTVTLTHDEKDISKSSVSVVIKAASINTGINQRDAHLRTADFFDVDKYPKITFQSKHIEKRANQLVAAGTLTMHGVAKEIELPFAITGVNKDPATGKMNIGYSARIAINRRDFGITWRHQSVPNFVGDTVEVEIELTTRAVPIDAK